jgi:hypothetical protein
MIEAFGSPTLDVLAQIALLGLLAGILIAVATHSCVPVLISVFGLAYLGRYVYRLSE